MSDLMYTLRCLRNVQTEVSVILFKSILLIDFPISVNGNATLLAVHSKWAPIIRENF